MISLARAIVRHQTQRLERWNEIIERFPDESLGRELVYFRLDFPLRFPELDTNDWPEETAALLEMGRMVHCKGFPIDRTGSLPLPLRATCGSLPEPHRGDVPRLADLMDRRAAELLEQPGEIRLFWSGGIDSTAALVALLRNAARGARERITVWMNDASIGEYPLFFRKFIEPEDGLRIRNFGSVPPANVYLSRSQAAIAEAAGEAEFDGGIVVTGECGDQLHGSSAIFGNELLDAPAERVLDAPGVRRWREVVEAFNARAPYRLATAPDVLWWWNFAVKWADVCHRSLLFCRSAGQIAAARHFFRRRYFQQWAMSKPELRRLSRPEDYKMELKRYIEEFTKDPEYRRDKLKFGSLGVDLGVAAAVDDRGNPIRFGQTSTFDLKMTARYGSGLHRFLNHPEPFQPARPVEPRQLPKGT